MREDQAGLEQRRKLAIARTQMVDPDRRIDQDHGRVARWRGGAFSLDWVPPSRASRRALSRSIRALSASRTSADLCFTPVKACAFAMSSSSSARVRRIDTIFFTD